MRHEESDRTIELSEMINAPLDKVWAAWTSTDGIQSWLVPSADIDLRVGGKFEIFFAPDAPEGSRGAEGCTILSYSPGRMLSFTWNAPPTIPELRKLGPCTWIVIEFESVGDKTDVHFKQFGIGTGPEWDEYLLYFQRAWPNVFGALKKHFE